MMALLFAIVLAMASAAAASNCSAPTLFVDIHDRLVDGKPEFYQYGLFVGMGTPYQNNSLWPAIGHNETTFASTNFCGSSSPASCNNNTHGHVSVEASESWQNTTYTSTDAPIVNNQETLSFGTDDLNIWTHYFDPSPATLTLLKNFPMTIKSNYMANHNPFFTAGTLGLGSASTVLGRLHDDAIITSPSFGFYLGTAYERAGGVVNGSIVFGGYDSGRFHGNVHQYQQASAPLGMSPYKVSIKQMSLVTRDDTEVALITDDGFDGYISTSEYPVHFPRSVMQRLSTALSATPAENDDNTLRLPNPYNGNLTITLSDGFTISFPPEWITNISSITPFSAEFMTSNNSSTTISDNEESGPFILGAAFLHHLYMFVNHGATPATFSLAEAKLYDNYVQPEPFCTGFIPTPAEAPRINSFAAQGMIGAVIGGVIGGIALFCATYFYFRKSLQRKYAKHFAQEDYHAINGIVVAGAKKKKGGVSDTKGSRDSKRQKIVQFLAHPKEGQRNQQRSVNDVQQYDRRSSHSSSSSEIRSSKGKNVVNSDVEMSDYPRNQEILDIDRDNFGGTMQKSVSQHIDEDLNDADNNTIGITPSKRLGSGRSHPYAPLTSVTPTTNNPLPAENEHTHTHNGAYDYQLSPISPALSDFQNQYHRAIEQSSHEVSNSPETRRGFAPVPTHDHS